MEKRKLAKIPSEEASDEMVRFSDRATGTHIITTREIEKDLLMLNFYPIKGLKKGKKEAQIRTFFSKNDYITQDLTTEKVKRKCSMERRRPIADGFHAGKSRICSPDCQKRSSRRRKQKISSVRIRDRVRREGGVMKFIARKPVVRTEVYRKYGFTYVEHKPCYCPRCNHVLNAGPNFQPKYCSECGQKIDFSEVKWEEEKILEHAGRRLANE